MTNVGINGARFFTYAKIRTPSKCIYYYILNDPGNVDKYYILKVPTFLFVIN